jgi:hypothetical protein
VQDKDRGIWLNKGWNDEEEDEDDDGNDDVDDEVR